VAAVLNVADDHIGTDGIRDIEELARIKGLVARAARKLLVLNGEDPRCVAMVDEAEAEHICYVTMAADPGTLIKAHIAAGGMAVTLRPDDDGALIEFHDGGEVTRILPASDLPSAFGGKAMHNVQNAMLAVALGYGMGASIADIRSGLLASSRITRTCRDGSIFLLAFHFR
jgi:cyanophycin synthetase